MEDAKTKRQLVQVLQRHTSKSFGLDFDRWYNYIWNKPPAYIDSYFEFKAKLHSLIDPKFRAYFSGRQQQATIRLDEVRWGGVKQDGIPPLRNPHMIMANEAHYLQDSNIVFGISVNGDARVYPKRILAWHEMFTDMVGDIPVAGVYCTLCGTVILYKTVHNNVPYNFGTSGFLYRSNKLMYDQQTQSLWSTLEGKPVIGPLVGQGIELEYLSVVTTTWGEWKKAHPHTKVLSLETGHRRDYGEGVAYRDYFSTDDLMFTVPETDGRLRNKQSILAIRLPDETDQVVAISSDFLKRHQIYKDKIGVHQFTVLTSRKGAHRVYLTEDIELVDLKNSKMILDTQGEEWEVSEDFLLQISTGRKLRRLPAYNAFWFGFQAAFPDVKLIK